MINQTIQVIETIERLLQLEIKPSIYKRDEQACLMRMQANLAELKFLIIEAILEEK